jgi:predicted aspartyl protease
VNAVRVSFERALHLMMVKARVNGGKRQYNFIVDTAAMTALDSSVAGELGITPEIEVDAMDSTGARRKIGMARLEKIELGGASVRKVSAAVFDFSNIRLVKRNIDGIIGSNFLRFFTVIIEYDKRTITLVKAPLKTADCMDCIRMEFESGLSHAFAPEIECLLNGRKTLLVLDTGFGGNIMMPMSLYRDIKGPGEDALRKCTGSSGGGAFEMTAAHHEAVLPVFKIGTREWKNMPVLVAEPAIETPLLGYGFLSGFTVSIDYPNYTIHLRPRDGVMTLNQNAISTGLKISRKNNGETVICGFMENSPAHKSGIAIGDLVMEINGRQAAVLDFTVLKTMMDDGSAAVLDIKVKRAGRIRRFTIKKEKIFNNN